MNPEPNIVDTFNAQVNKLISALSFRVIVAFIAATLPVVFMHFDPTTNTYLVYGNFLFFMAVIFIDAIAVKKEATKLYLQAASDLAEKYKQP